MAMERWERWSIEKAFFPCLFNIIYYDYYLSLFLLLQLLLSMVFILGITTDMKSGYRGAGK